MEKEKKEKKVAVVKDEVKKKTVAKKKVATKKDDSKKTVKKTSAKKETKKEVKTKDAENKKVKEDKNKDALKKTFTITVPNSEIEKSVDEIAEKYSSDMKMSGFRKGKVPAELLKTRYKGALNEEALNKIVEEYVFKKIEADKMRIVSQPVIDNIDHKEGKDLTAEVTVEIFPEFDLPELEKVEVEVSVKDLKIDAYDEKKQIELILNSRKRAVSVKDKAIKNEDIVGFNLQTKILKTKRMTPRVEESVEILKEKEFYIKDINKELLGKKEGDEFSFEREYPKDYSKKKWAGEKVEHFIKITRVQEYFTPTLDKKTLEELGFKTEAALKKKLKEEFETHSKNQLDEIKNNKRIEKLLSIVDFPIPESLVLKEIERIEKDPQAGSLIYDKELLRKKAEESVKFSLIHFEIQKKYEVDANADDVEAEYKKMSDQFGMPVKEIRKYYSAKEQKESLKDRIKGEKISKIIKEKIKIKEIK